MLLAFILFLFLIIILYVKSIVSFLKSDQAAQNRGSILFDDSSAPEGDDSIASELELERNLKRNWSASWNRPVPKNSSLTNRKISAD